MILTTEAGGQRSNCSTVPVPEQFACTRVDTLKFINTLQEYPALWKVKSVEHKNEVLKQTAAKAVAAAIGV